MSTSTHDQAVYGSRLENRLVIQNTDWDEYDRQEAHDRILVLTYHLHRPMALENFNAHPYT